MNSYVMSTLMQGVLSYLTCVLCLWKSVQKQKTLMFVPGHDKHVFDFQKGKTHPLCVAIVMLNKLLARVYIYTGT